MILDVVVWVSRGLLWMFFFGGFCMVSKPPAMSSASSPALASSSRGQPRVLEVGEDTEPAVESYFATSAVPETIDESIFDGSFTWVLVTWYISHDPSTRIYQLFWCEKHVLTCFDLLILWWPLFDLDPVVGMGDEKWIWDWGSPTSTHRHPDIYIIQHLVHFNSFCLFYSALALNSSWPRWIPISSGGILNWWMPWQIFAWNMRPSTRASPWIMWSDVSAGPWTPVFWIHPPSRSPGWVNQPCKNPGDHWWNIKVRYHRYHSPYMGLPSKHLNKLKPSKTHKIEWHHCWSTHSPRIWWNTASIPTSQTPSRWLENLDSMWLAPSVIAWTSGNLQVVSSMASVPRMR